MLGQLCKCRRLIVDAPALNLAALILVNEAVPLRYLAALNIISAVVALAVLKDYGVDIIIVCHCSILTDYKNFIDSLKTVISKKNGGMMLISRAAENNDRRGAGFSSLPAAR